MRMRVLCYALIFLAFTLMYSCSVRTNLFVQNSTSKPVFFKIVYNTPIEISEYKKYTFHYEHGILKPKRFLKKKTLKSLQIKQLNAFTWAVEIPENATSRIAATSNYRYFDKIKSIEFNNEKLTIEEFVTRTVRRKTNQIFKIDE